MSDLEANLSSIRERIATAAARAGRSAEDITLVVVSKTQPAKAVLAAHRLGLRHFGENRVGEAAEKIPRVRAMLNESDTPQQPIWHMVGHLQSRKAGAAAELFQMLHSLDSVKLARKLSRLCIESGRGMPVLLEMNVSGEQSKYGFPAYPCSDKPEQRMALFTAVEAEKVSALPPDNRTAAPGDIAYLRPLDFNDLRPHVAKQHGGERPE